MPSKEDLLFCKIAVMNGLVSETNAKKVLALVDKREKDNGRRPFIGAVFTKYNLMRTPDVEKVLEAVKKRSGGTTSAVSKSSVRRSAVSKSGRRPRAQTTRIESKAVKAEKRMDPATMWIGIGALVVCVGIVLTIVFLVASGGHGKPGAPKTAAVAAKDKEAEEAAERLKRLTAAPTKTGAAAAPVEPAKPALKTELPELLKQEIAESISASMDIEPAQAVVLLEDLKKTKVVGENYVVPQNLEDAIKNRRAAAGDAPPAQDAAPAPAGDTPPAAAPPAEEKAPQ